MRAGAYTIHQSLTAEAAAVLKLALALARQRGHAQVTPLHVAFALLTGPAAAAACAPPLYSSPVSPAAAVPYGLLKRACLRSHPHPHPAAPSSHSHGAPPQLQFRALELCFNVALNRLPSSTAAAAPSLTSPLMIQPSPTLSNALVAALKRAQSNQRRGCVVELHQPPPPPPATVPQPQPLLATIKVELEQLAISILDDPTVSRVLREACFSSAAVKSSLEEEATTALMPPPPPPIPLHPSISSGGKGGGDRFGLWPAQFLAAPPAGPRASACDDDDVRAVLEVMVRKQQGQGQGRRGSSSNPVVVGDSASMAEAVARELLGRIERGGDGVPEELAGAHILELRLSYVHVRLMSRADVDARAAELRRSVDAAAVRGRGGLVVYVGDLRWALDEGVREPNDDDGDDGDGHAAVSSYSPAEHMVAELGRLVDDLRRGGASRGRCACWLVAAASYQTYMRWQAQQRRRRRRRRPLVESAASDAWALQAVVVPTGSGTALSLNSLCSSSSSSSSSLPSAIAGVLPAMVTPQQLRQNPFAMAVSATAFAGRAEQDDMQLVLCTECTKNYESEAASLAKAEPDAEAPRASLPGWLVKDGPPAAETPHKMCLIELKRKWSRLCRKLHLCSDPCSPPCPWWSGSCLLPASKSKPAVAGYLGFDGLMEEQRKSRAGQWLQHSPSRDSRWGLSPCPPMGPGCQSVGTTLALGSHPLSDSATSDCHAPGTGSGAIGAAAAVRELEQRLRRNIPWQPGAIVAEIAKAAVSSSEGAWLYVKGSDHIATRRAVTVIAETRCGSADRVICTDASKFSCAEELCSDVVSRASEMGGEMLVVIVDDVENASRDVANCLVAASRSGSLKDHRSGQVLDLSGCIMILTASKLPGGGAGDRISLRLWLLEDEASSGALKRKTESPQGESKRARHDVGMSRGSLHLNLCAEDDPVPSDITDEGDSGDSSEHGGLHSVLEALAARVITLDKEGGGGGDATASIRTMLGRAIGQGGTGTRVEETAVQALAAASGQFLEEELESWTTEVLEPAVATIKNGGKGKVIVLGLGAGGGVRETAGFMGSVLPSRIQVD